MTSEKGNYGGYYLYGKNPQHFPLRRTNTHEFNWQLMIMRKFEPWEEELKLVFDRLFESGIPQILKTMDIDFETNPYARGTYTHTS